MSESWWASLEAHPLEAFRTTLERLKSDPIIPTEPVWLSDRPKELQHITSSWLKRNDLDGELIINSIYRYDCRIRGIKYFIGTYSDWMPWYRYDNITAICLDRAGENKWIAEGDYFMKNDLTEALLLTWGEFLI